MSTLGAGRGVINENNDLVMVYMYSGSPLDEADAQREWILIPNE